MSAIAGSPRSSPLSYFIDGSSCQTRALGILGSCLLYLKVETNAGYVAFLIGDELFGLKSSPSQQSSKYQSRQENGVQTTEAKLVARHLPVRECNKRTETILRAPDDDMSFLQFIYDFATDVERHYAPWRVDINETRMSSVIEQLVGINPRMELRYKLFDCSGIRPVLELKNPVVFYRELYLVSRYVKRQGSSKPMPPSEHHRDWNRFVERLNTTDPETYFRQYFERERKFLYSTFDGLMIRVHLACSRLACDDPSVCGDDCSTCRFRLKCGVPGNCPMCYSTPAKMSNEERRSHKIPELLRVTMALLDAQAQRKDHHVAEAEIDKLAAQVQELRELVVGNHTCPSKRQRMFSR